MKRGIFLGIFCASLPALAQGPSGLEALHQRLTSGQIPDVHAVLVSQHGKPVAQWYFEGRDEARGSGTRRTIKFSAATLHDLRSVSKSVVSMLFGIAIQEGAIKSLDTPVLDYFPEYKDLQTPVRRQILLRHLLTMTSGLTWDETPSYKDPRNSETAMDMAPDRYRYVLSRPIESPPGMHWRYSGGDVALIAAVLARTTKVPLDEYSKRLFAPLGISRYTWFKDAGGVAIAASGLRLTPPEMLDIGLLVLHRGRNASGHQIVPAAWIDDSTSPHARAFESPGCTIEYGYFWWLGLTCAEPWISAIGNGGQRIFLVPSHDLVIVTTAGLYNSSEQSQMNAVLDSIEGALD